MTTADPRRPPNRAVVDEAVAASYRQHGWWADSTHAERLAELAVANPHGTAYITGSTPTSWAQTLGAAQRLAGVLAADGAGPGDRVAVLLPDGVSVHAAFFGIELAGATIVGIGARAGVAEVRHLLTKTAARWVVTHAEHRGAPANELIAAAAGETHPRHVIVPRFEVDADAEIMIDGRVVEPVAVRSDHRLGPDDLWLVNSTSGTTGLPKCVQHTQNRWRYFHQQAQRNGALNADDVFMSVVPAPFGFGIWTAHVTPLLLGVPTVICERFDADEVCALIERHRVTVLCCVSTQFIMLLNSPEMSRRDLSSLRVMFTGGEAVPYERALAFEERTGASVLQFYGSNETGLLSGTVLGEPLDKRLNTAGKIVPEMEVRLFDHGRDVTASGYGQPGCRGPATSVGYLDDEGANAELYTSDGWMLMGDLVTIDAEGYLTVVGRTSDIIIRGGKNISAPQVEAEVATHPAVVHAVAVAMPDPVFGERVCVYVQLAEGAAGLGLEELVSHLRARGMSPETLPERLIVLDELPLSSGGKVAKGELRADIRRRVEAGDTG